MTDVRSSPMLPLRWSGSPAGRLDPGNVPGTQWCIEHDTDEHRGTGVSNGAEEPVQPRPDQTSPASRADTQEDVGGGPEVVVRTSSRRRKTATAYWERDRIVVVMPTRVPRAERPALVDWLVTRVIAKRPGATASDEALATRAAKLAERYVDGVRPASVRWVTNQAKRWGSCSTRTGEIRLSHRLRAAPGWVLDATIVHELAHLIHPDHSADFHAVADRYPRQHDALVFLEGYSLGLQPDSDGAAGYDVTTT
ncbi:MAG: M48 metallopeptidase family protein [Acidimicrobiales bacterium]